MIKFWEVVVVVGENKREINKKRGKYKDYDVVGLQFDCKPSVLYERVVENQSYPIRTHSNLSRLIQKDRLPLLGV
jgi:hypothetical protein